MYSLPWSIGILSPCPQIGTPLSGTLISFIIKNQAWWLLLKTFYNRHCGGVKCKHVWAVEFSQALRKEVEVRRIEPITQVSECIFCGSENIKRYGVRKNKSGEIQRFLCDSCGKTFSVNIGFEKMKHSPQAITTAMHGWWDEVLDSSRSGRYEIYARCEKIIPIRQRSCREETKDFDNRWSASLPRCLP